MDIIATILLSADAYLQMDCGKNYKHTLDGDVNDPSTLIVFS